MNTTISSKSNYEISSVRQVVRTSEVWVREMTVESGQEVPWHKHTDVQDYCYGLKGTTLVEMLDAEGKRTELRLEPGASCVLTSGTPHRLTCAQGRQATYLLIQQGKYDFIKVPQPAVA